MPAKSRKHIVDCGSVGDPPKTILGLVETVKFIIYDFDQRFKSKESIESPVLKAHGLRWTIECYPRGFNGAHESYLSCFLQCLPKRAVTAVFSFRCKTVQSSDCRRVFTTKGEYYGYEDWIGIDEVPENLEPDGSFIIEVDIQMATAAEHKDVWYPKKLQKQDILVDLFQDAASSETSDVIFSVESNVYHAHKNILALRCKKLYEIAKECDSEEPISIDSQKSSNKSWSLRIP